MKLIGIYTKSHQVLKDEWFLPTLKDDYHVQLHASKLSGQGRYMEDDWVKGVILKSDIIIEAIRENWGDVIVYSDMDVQFFSPTKKLILSSIKNQDIVCQKDTPTGALCTGFFAVRCNDKTLWLWKQVRTHLYEEQRDQLIFNRILHSSANIRYNCLPTCFFGGGTFNGKAWLPEQRIFVSVNPVMHHANWVIGINHKIDQLKAVKSIVRKGLFAIIWNNIEYRLRENQGFIKDDTEFISTTKNNYDLENKQNA